MKLETYKSIIELLKGGVNGKSFEFKGGGKGLLTLGVKFSENQKGEMSYSLIDQAGIEFLKSQKQFTSKKEMLENSLFKTIKDLGFKSSDVKENKITDFSKLGKGNFEVEIPEIKIDNDKFFENDISEKYKGTDDVFWETFQSKNLVSKSQNELNKIVEICKRITEKKQNQKFNDRYKNLTVQIRYAEEAQFQNKLIEKIKNKTFTLQSDNKELNGLLEKFTQYSINAKKPDLFLEIKELLLNKNFEENVIKVLPTITSGEIITKLGKDQLVSTMSQGLSAKDFFNKQEALLTFIEISSKVDEDSSKRVGYKLRIDAYGQTNGNQNIEFNTKEDAEKYFIEISKGNSFGFGSFGTIEECKFWSEGLQTFGKTIEILSTKDTIKKFIFDKIRFNSNIDITIEELENKKERYEAEEFDLTRQLGKGSIQKTTMYELLKLFANGKTWDEIVDFIVSRIKNQNEDGSKIVIFS